ncbi:hypothetical protein F7734_26210 [Scytonema sp. UIC 10036]|uniref:hypothetical protein n=1 Tax=Scytonema sp. UIC 10036 TaxID=2304196 RepID=UPI0012DA4959|nr:hypothetical protein [Scytonema sp. UIC 10036]MUG95660.1 hypothetical protein [Scytonema sp. UIC 10036]
MLRSDLLALTADDLTVLSNRGLVKRALKEIEEGRVSSTITEDARGNVIVRWSDEVECVVPAGEELSDKHCSCSAIAVCRHVIELIKSSKPIARIHTLACTVKFLVPGDIRYTYCDCSEPSPCRHTLFGVWAFRQLSSEQMSGIISTQKETTPVPIDVLDEIENNLRSLLFVGMRGLSATAIGRLRRLEQTCRNSGLIWNAEILAELVQEKERYDSRDARFSPTKVVELIGELCIRCDAIRNDTGAVPQLFIHGSQADKLTEIGAARLLGLGCGVQVQRQNVRLIAYFQDTDSGTVVAVCQDFAESSQEANTEPPEFWKMAEKPAFKQVSFKTLGAGEMLLKGGKRTPNYQFLPSRTQVIVNPQTFEWESLRSPLLVEDFHSLRSHLQLQPPSSLRPRRLTENFHVFWVHQVENVQFSSIEQAVIAVLYDCDRNQAILKFPYTYRNRVGTETLLEHLLNKRLLFVAGHIYLSTEGLVITPVSLIFQTGESRIMLQPSICQPLEIDSNLNLSNTENTFLKDDLLDGYNRHPIASFLEQLQQVMSDLIVMGLERIDSQSLRHCQNICDFGKAMGFVDCIKRMTQFIKILEQKNNSLDWDWQPATEIILELSLLIKLSQDIMYRD